MKKRSGRKLKFKKLKFFIFLTLAILAFALFIFASYVGYTPEKIAGMLTKDYYYEAVIIFLALVAIAAATTLPITAVMIPGIVIFSFLYNVIYTTLGILIGAIFTFLMSRYFGRDFVNEYAEIRGGKMKALNDLVEERSFKLIILFNFVYFFPSNLAHMIAGLTKTKIHKFLFATIVGNFPNTFGVSLVIYGFYWLNYVYIISGIIILVLVSAIPLYFYRKHIKDIIIVAYSEDTYKRLKKAEKTVEKEVEEERKRIGV